MSRNHKWIVRGGIILALATIGLVLLWPNPLPKRTGQETLFSVEIAGEINNYRAKEGMTVEEALQEAGIFLNDGDKTFPEKTAKILPGAKVMIWREKMIMLEDGKEKNEKKATGKTVEEFLSESKILLDPDDIVEPSLETALGEGMTVSITRVEVTEEEETKTLAFKKVEEEDGSLSWQTKKVVQKGEAGEEKTVYRVSRHNGEVVRKEKLRTEITKEPIPEKTVIGTKVTVVKTHTGAASWYAHTGTLSAANPWLPIGSYARVINTANGKSVIVRINDRGPFGPGRIIDLDKVAFAKIADLGTGVINVKMEEIK